MTDTAVIVPVMGRPQNAAPFMASLRASTGLTEVYVMATAGDTETVDAWEAAGAEAITAGSEVTFAEKVNIGYECSVEPWLFLVGDDVRFHPNWLANAQIVAGRRAHVIGTNDLGNPAVMAGQHATHLLIRRSYVDEVGASWDGPKVVCHEGYRHNFVDTEIVAAAKKRGVWAMARSSVVEHLHPFWGKADTDAVYELGQSSYDADQALFDERMRVHA